MYLLASTRTLAVGLVNDNEMWWPAILRVAALAIKMHLGLVRMKWVVLPYVNNEVGEARINEHEVGVVVTRYSRTRVPFNHSMAIDTQFFILHDCQLKQLLMSTNS